jgi:predicted DNA-binding protein with PD1-like motif
MKTKTLHSKGKAERMFAVELDIGEDPMSLLAGLVQRRSIGPSSITATGAFASAVLGFLDRSRRTYRRIVVAEHAEVLSFTGEVADHAGKPVIHVRAILGLADGTTRGGHLLEGSVWPGLEIVVSEDPAHRRREFDPEVGLSLLLGRHPPESMDVAATSDDEVPTWIHDLHPARLP